MRSGQYESPYFEDGETLKYYYNVVFGFAQTLVRGSRLRIQDIKLTSLDGKFLKLVQIFKGAVRHFLKYNEWVDKREEVLEEIVHMGHVVTKVVDGETTIVDLRRLCFQPNAKSLKFDPSAEQIEYNYESLVKDYGENKEWETIKTFYEKLSKDGKKVNIIEYWTEGEFDGEITKGCIKYLDRSEEDPRDHDVSPDEWSPYLELERFKTPYKVKTANKRERKIYGEWMPVFPYDEQGLVNIPGRYLKMGTYELCRPGQEDYNEKRNLKRKFDRLALRGILVHKIGAMRQDSDGEALTQEFLKRMDTGAAAKIYSDESLERLNLGSTTSDTLAMTNDLFEFMRFMLGITPIAIGQDSNNQTATFAVTQANAQQTVYQSIKNKVGRLFERLFQDFLLEDISEEIMSGNSIPINLEKEELAELDNVLVKNEVNSELNRMRPNISEEVGNAIIKQRTQEQEEMGASRYIDVSDPVVKRKLKKMFKDLAYIVEFQATDEILDPSAKADIIIKADQMQNVKLRDRVLDLTGIDPRELRESDSEKAEAMKAKVEEARAMAEATNIPEQPIIPAVAPQM